MLLPYFRGYQESWFSRQFPSLRRVFSLICLLRARNAQIAGPLEVALAFFAGESSHFANFPTSASTSWNPSWDLLPDPPYCWVTVASDFVEASVGSSVRQHLIVLLPSSFTSRVPCDDGSILEFDGGVRSHNLML